MTLTSEELAVLPPLGRALGCLEATASLMELCFPTLCCVCGTPGSVLCEACAAQVKRIDAAHACPRCGAPFGALVCTECSVDSRVDIGAVRIGVSALFTEVSAGIVRSYKDRYDRRLALIIANFLTEAFFTYGLDSQPIQAITTVPPRHENLRQRGFDHAALVARVVADRLSLPYLTLLHITDLKDQRGLTRQERTKNMEHAFVFDVSAAPHHLQHILLIDDVITTGATVRAAVAVLKEAGGIHTSVLAFARAYGGVNPDTPMAYSA